MTPQTLPPTILPRPLTRLILLAGPLTSLLAAPHLPLPHLGTDQIRTMAWSLLVLFWSPVAVSLPAILLQNARDAVLPHWRGPARTALRGVVLIPLLLRRGSPVRVEMTLSLAGWALGWVWAWPLLF
jgi:hypothetical protein